MINALDVVILGVIVGGAYMGYVRGLLAELVALLGVLLGILLASHFYLSGAEVLLPLLHDQVVTAFIAFLMLYAVGIAVFFLVYLVIKSNMAGGAIGPVSRIPAFLLGGLKGALLVLAIVFLIIFFWGPDNSFTSGGRLLPRLLISGRVVIRLLPETMHEPLTRYIDKLVQEREKRLSEAEERGGKE
ncbi:MAG: CvpA family protein [Deltaproteobacteria bacterium]|nr:CvpA family protein [Deltaproteobacteria bacterium]